MYIIHIISYNLYVIYVIFTFFLKTIFNFTSCMIFIVSIGALLTEN